MHLRKITLLTQKYPTKQQYPFNLPILNQSSLVQFESPVTFFVGENGTGKSTLLEGIAQKCRIHIWQDTGRTRFNLNPYENALYNFIKPEWTDGIVPGCFFASQIFRHFAEILDDWAVSDPGVLDYFGGNSLLTLSHGQSLMAFFRSRFKVKGLYLLDEPETALSAKKQIQLLKLLQDMTAQGHAQFIIATHSPILLACPNAKIYSFDYIPIKTIDYEQTEHYKIYKDFLNNREKFLNT
jgi:predicted ATPase